MNAGFFSGAITGLLFASFIAGWWWAWRDARKPGFDAAARLPLDDDRTETPR